MDEITLSNLAAAEEQDRIEDALAVAYEKVNDALQACYALDGVAPGAIEPEQFRLMEVIYYQLQRFVNPE